MGLYGSRTLWHTTIVEGLYGVGVLGVWIFIVLVLGIIALFFFFFFDFEKKSALFLKNL